VQELGTVKTVPMDLGDLHSSLLTHLTFWPYKKPHLGREDIAKISALTAIKRLELEGWMEWEDLTVLQRLSQLEKLSCESSYMLLDLVALGVRSGSWKALKAIILGEDTVLETYYNPFYGQWLKDKGIDAEMALTILADSLLQLPQLSSFQSRMSWYPSEYPEYRSRHERYTLMRIAKCHPTEWRQLEDQSGLLLYYRVRV